MTNCVTFQTKLASVMDVLAKAAVSEISKLFDDGCAILRLEMCRREDEIAALKRKLLIMENERQSLRSKAQEGCLSPLSSSRREGKPANSADIYMKRITVVAYKGCVNSKVNSSGKCQ